ncbi:MAG: DUF308 domain-containing protein [Candidatus Eremiobacteraeota bacterium]|nr:DUF308 domain-containing protein [Candidatus Eremiobacteraeota bacterium]MBV8340737.1 DUF308 domain-containing protein [Candidatus Eremiobacteraeota bacterium]MBV8595024.1 DUF308 domain-containing protein [Candidatus Eremiobacteraeota bacterium]MBV8668483.1 DUF308 domain-containing protein [Candidatus Eremiobacteraeota bacterium]
MQLLASKWWTFVLRGIVALALAFFAFTQPQSIATVLVYVVAAYFIISGLFEFFAGLSFTGIGSWWALILVGVVQVMLGIIMIAKPGVGPLALAYLVGIWAFSTGLVEISSAIAFRNVITNEFWWILLGLVTLGLGVYVVLRPDLGVLSLVYAVGIYAVLAGITLIATGFRIKNLAQQVRKDVTTLKQSA